MVLRRGKKGRAPGTELVLVQDEHGLLVSGPSTAVATTVEWLTSIERGSVRARTSGADQAAVAATGTALAGSTSEYVRLTDGSQALLREHGAIPGSGGTFRGFVKDVDGHFAGILDFQSVGLRPEQALALRLMRRGLDRSRRIGLMRRHSKAMAWAQPWSVP